jgi:hypothetical protein
MNTSAAAKKAGKVELVEERGKARKRMHQDADIDDGNASDSPTEEDIVSAIDEILTASTLQRVPKRASGGDEGKSAHLRGAGRCRWLALPNDA